jgi:hypothetical protein
MNRFRSLMKRGATVAPLLAQAGMDPDYVKPGRSFASNWAWDDGQQAFATIWLHEILDPNGVPKWSITDPRSRTDLEGQRKKRAQEIFDILVRRAGEPVRVVLVEQKDPGSDTSSGRTKARGVDPEPWFALVEGDTVLLQRGSPPGRRDVSVEGEPMQPRAPSWSLRETRPDQALFRQRVAAKTGNRCALTGAPPEVCDAAHFPWANWRADNEAHHGVLLRRDLHAALDCGLIEIEPSGRVVVSEYLATTSDEYRDLHDREVPVGGAPEAPIDA